MAYRDDGVYKIISIKYNGHRYYVQEMPAPWGVGGPNMRCYTLMCDRKRIYHGVWSNAKDAIITLLGYIQDDVKRQTELEL